MKKTVLLLFTLFTGIAVFAQNDTTKPYMKNRMLPAFSLLGCDSVAFNQTVVREGKNTIFMMFHPECDHCQKQLDEFLSIPELGQEAELILISGETVPKNRIFYNTNHLEKLPFVHLGKDHKFFFGSFFEPRSVPVLVFYNKKREFVAIYRSNIDKKTILEALKN